MALSYLNFVPIGKMLFNALNQVIGAHTDKSKPGNITKSEITEVLKSATNQVVTKLANIVIED